MIDGKRRDDVFRTRRPRTRPTKNTPERSWTRDERGVSPERSRRRTSRRGRSRLAGTKFAYCGEGRGKGERMWVDVAGLEMVAELKEHRLQLGLFNNRQTARGIGKETNGDSPGAHGTLIHGGPVPSLYRSTFLYASRRPFTPCLSVVVNGLLLQAKSLLS